MEERVIMAVLEIRNMLTEIRDVMLLQRDAYEKAIRESGNAKEALSTLLNAFPLPPQAKAAMESLVKKGS